MTMYSQLLKYFYSILSIVVLSRPKHHGVLFEKDEFLFGYGLVCIYFIFDSIITIIARNYYYCQSIYPSNITNSLKAPKNKLNIT